MVEAEVVAKRGLFDSVDVFQHMLASRESSSSPAEARTCSIPILPTSGLGLCPLASQISTPEPRVAAKYKEFVTAFDVSLGSKAREEIEVRDAAFVA
jgi:hypothetical protein